MVKEKSKSKYLTKAITCPDGRRKYIRAKTQAELDRKVNQFRAEVGLGINVNDNTRVVEWAQTWVDVYKRPKLEPNSVQAILSKLNCHIIPVIGAMRLRDVRPTDCAAVMAGLDGMKKSSATQVRTVMKDLFECAVENRLIASNPVTRSVVASGAPSTDRVPLTLEQLEQVCAAAKQRSPDLYTFVLLCGYAGLRAGEALGLNLEDVDLAAGLIHVRTQLRPGGGGVTTQLKTATSDRYVPMPPVLLAHMTTMKRTRGGFIFDVSKPYLYHNMSERLARLSTVRSDGAPRRGVSPGRMHVGFYVHPHLLRHTYATTCFASGLDVKEVQYLLGHSTSQTTMEVYVHYLSASRLTETAQKIEQAFPPHRLAALG